MAKGRWGAEAPSDSTAARERLIDSAEACFKRFGLAKTTVEDVAQNAKVSRATFYRYFESRDDLILAVLVREGGRFLEKLSKRLSRSTSFSDALVDGVLYTVKVVKADENLSLLFAPESAGLTTSIPGASMALFDLTEPFLRPLFEAAREAGDFREDLDFGDAAEWVIRVVLSLLTVEGSKRRSEARTAAFLRSCLMPVFAPVSTMAGNGHPTVDQQAAEALSS